MDSVLLVIQLRLYLGLDMNLRAIIKYVYALGNSNLSEP